MIKSIFVLLFLGALVFSLKMLGLLSVSPFMLFLSAFGLAIILLMLGFVIFAKTQNIGGHEQEP
jgi:hypothetical protein